MPPRIIKDAGIPLALFALSSGGIHQEAIADVYKKNNTPQLALEETYNIENSYFLDFFENSSGGYYIEKQAAISKKGHPLLRKLKAMSDALPDSAFDDVPHDYSTSYKKEPRAS